MLSGVVYFARAAAALFVVAIGLIMLAATLASKERTAWTVGFSAAFAIAGVLAWPRRPNAWRRDPPTDRQIAFAQDLGIQIPPGISKGEISDLISQAKAIRDQL